jgi:hypothetical protein
MIENWKFIYILKYCEQFLKKEKIFFRYHFKVSLINLKMIKTWVLAFKLWKKIEIEILMKEESFGNETLLGISIL